MPFKNILKLLQNSSIQILLFLFLYFTFASKLPIEVHQGLYTISLMIKDLLLWMLPIIVCFFIAYTLSSFEKKAPLFIFEAFSNFTSIWYAYGCGHIATYNVPLLAKNSVIEAFSPLWQISDLKPIWWSADKGIYLGVLVGLVAAFRFPFLKKIVLQGKKKAEWLLSHFFAKLIPLFILGFVAKMYKTQFLNQLINRYSTLLFWLLLILAVYMTMLFFLGSGFAYQSFLKSIKNLFPAAGIAFTSGCSLSAIPWTIEGTAKNLQNPELAKTLIPATTNIQQIGDCIANAFLCFLIYYHFHGHAPSLSVWIPFSLVFVLARFTTAAVIGGSIFIMIPIYEAYLGFNAEMIAMILAFNILLDPLITCSNVLSNGALCRVFEKTWMKLVKIFSAN